MHLAPLASALHPMLAGLPFITRQWFACKPREGAIAKERDPGAVYCPAGHCAAISREGTSRFSGPSARRKGICTVRVFCLRHSVEKSGTGQCSPTNFSRRATIPQVWHNGSLKKILIDRQNWMAASQNTAGRPGRPSGGARQIISSSTHISKDPACAAMRWSWTSSSCDSGREMACTCRAPNGMDPQSESHMSEFCNNAELRSLIKIRRAAVRAPIRMQAPRMMLGPYAAAICFLGS
jgi:hypothetical protein